MERRPIFATDVDGTLNRSNLLIDLVAQLVTQGSFLALIEDQVNDVKREWMSERNRETYNQYMNTLIGHFISGLKRGLTESEMNYAVSKMAKNFPGQTYVYGRKRIQSLKDTHNLVAISGSPIEAVRAFVAPLGIQTVHATTFEIVEGEYTGNVIHRGTDNKAQSLLKLVDETESTLKGSGAMGDTDNDIPMLEYTDHPEVFRPNKELLLHAQQKKWPIHLEIKDVIYRMTGSGLLVIENDFGKYTENP